MSIVSRRVVPERGKPAKNTGAGRAAISGEAPPAIAPFGRGAIELDTKRVAKLGGAAQWFGLIGDMCLVHPAEGFKRLLITAQGVVHLPREIPPDRRLKIVGNCGQSGETLVIILRASSHERLDEAQLVGVDLRLFCLRCEILEIRRPVMLQDMREADKSFAIRRLQIEHAPISPFRFGEISIATPVGTKLKKQFDVGRGPDPKRWQSILGLGLGIIAAGRPQDMVEVDKRIGVSKENRRSSPEAPTSASSSLLEVAQGPG